MLAWICACVSLVILDNATLAECLFFCLTICAFACMCMALTVCTWFERYIARKTLVCAHKGTHRQLQSQQTPGIDRIHMHKVT